MDIDKIAGLPAHPLFVHLPVVLIPLLALVAVALIVKQEWRDRFGAWFAAANVAMFVVIVLTMGAGEKLEERVGESALIEKHSELADQLRILWVLFTIVVIALVVIDRMRRSERTASWIKPVTGVLSVLVIAGAIATTVWDVRTGHAGAKAAWGDVPEPGAGGEADES